MLGYGGAARGRRGVGVLEGQVFGEGARGTGLGGRGDINRRGARVEDINRGEGGRAREMGEVGINHPKK